MGYPRIVHALAELAEWRLPPPTCPCCGGRMVGNGYLCVPCSTPENLRILRDAVFGRFTGG